MDNEEIVVQEIDTATEKKVDQRDHRGRTNKIITNKYNSVEFVYEEIKFSKDEYVEDSYKELDQLLEEEEYLGYITSVIATPKFSEFNQVTIIEKEKVTYQKIYQIKKKELNAFYAALLSNQKLDRYKLYLYMCFYLNIDKSKAFDMLSNLYKNHLVQKITREQSIFKNKLY